MQLDNNKKWNTHYLKNMLAFRVLINLDAHSGMREGGGSAAKKNIF